MFFDWIFTKKVKWIGYHDSCCNDDRNIITNDQSDYGQCVKCLRLFERGKR